MRKLIASLPTLMTTALNGLMCWGINQLPGKSDLPIPQELFFWLTISSVVGIAFFSTQSSGSQTTSETTNRSWVIGLPPVMGSVVLFALLKSGHLPSELAQYAGYASLSLFVIGTLLPTVRAFWETRKNNTVMPAIATGINQQEYKNRQALLNKVKNYWIKGVLEGSLSNRARIELGLEERFDAVQLDWQTPEQPRRSLPKGTKAINQFDKMGKGCTLLILGAPGAGKTTTLLEIASELIDRAEQDITLPIPVIFNLSSWAATKKQTIAEWLVEELDSRYQIPQKIGSNWIKNEELLLLLDGLDEVSEERRNDCAIAINNFKQSHGITQMVVCSRIKDYEALYNRLQFQGAIFIKDLTLEQINYYFDKAGNKLQGIKAAWINDKVLQELTKTPLMLSVIAIAYDQISVADLPQMPLKQKRKHLFNKYIQKMLERRQQNCKYSKEQIVRWLVWLAKQLHKKSNTIFLVERINISYTNSQMDRIIYAMLHGLSMGVIMSLILSMIAGFSKNIIIAFLLISILAGFTWGIHNQQIQSLENIRWSIPKSRKYFYAITIAGAFLFAVSSLMIGVFQGFVLSIITYAIFLFGSSGDNLDRTVTVNQGIWQSLKNGLLLSCMGFAGMIAFATITNIPLVKAGLLGLTFGLLQGLPGCIQHLCLRLIFCLRGYIPWNLARFLNYATERIFLHKVGGGYIFIHRSLLEHFASL